MLSLARSIVDRQLNLDEIAALEDKTVVELLRHIKGVGRWTVEYFLLRGLGRTHVFPGDDVGARYLVERLWPRGMKKENLILDAWLQNQAQPVILDHQTFAIPILTFSPSNSAAVVTAPAGG